MIISLSVAAKCVTFTLFNPYKLEICTKCVKSTVKYVWNTYDVIVGREQQMKRKDMIELLEKNGWYLKRRGGKSRDKLFKSVA